MVTGWRGRHRRGVDGPAEQVAPRSRPAGGSPSAPPQASCHHARPIASVGRSAACQPGDPRRLVRPRARATLRPGNITARVAKLADAADLGSAAARRKGSTPFPCTFEGLAGRRPRRIPCLQPPCQPVWWLQSRGLPSGRRRGSRRARATAGRRARRCAAQRGVPAAVRDPQRVARGEQGCGHEKCARVVRAQAQLVCRTLCDPFAGSAA